MWEQKWFLTVGFPFLFLGGLGDFLFPDIVGNTVNAIQAKDQELVAYHLKFWVVVIFIGSASQLISQLAFGYVSCRIGDSMRKRLFNSMIYKDVAFFDECRTGDLCKFTPTLYEYMV